MVFFFFQNLTDKYVFMTVATGKLAEVIEKGEKTIMKPCNRTLDRLLT